MSTLQTTTPTQLTTNQDFAVINGIGWVSQTKLAEMCGVGQNTISQAIKRNTYGCDTLNLSENNQLDAKSAYTVIVHYATQGKAEAIKTLALIGEAGMQAYIYHQAGYTITVEPPKPMTKRELIQDAKYDAQLEAINLRRKLIAAKSIEADIKHEQTMQALKDKHTKWLAESHKAKGVMQVGKLLASKHTITQSLSNIKSHITPADANYALIKLGYLGSDRKTITGAGSKYGVSNKAGNGIPPQVFWFDSEFPKLIKEIEAELISINFLNQDGTYPED